MKKMCRCQDFNVFLDWNALSWSTVRRVICFIFVLFFSMIIHGRSSLLQWRLRFSTSLNLTFRPIGYERVFLRLFKVAHTPFHLSYPRWRLDVFFVFSVLGSFHKISHSSFVTYFIWKFIVGLILNKNVLLTLRVFYSTYMHSCWAQSSYYQKRRVLASTTC